MRAGWKCSGTAKRSAPSARGGRCAWWCSRRRISRFSSRAKRSSFLHAPLLSRLCSREEFARIERGDFPFLAPALDLALDDLAAQSQVGDRQQPVELESAPLIVAFVIDNLDGRPDFVPRQQPFDFVPKRRVSRRGAVELPEERPRVAVG